MNYRRINLFGGPGCGKSTMAAEMFGQLKKFGYEVELIREYIKKWTYLETFPISYDQVYIFAKQMREEDVVLRSVNGLIITDCPCMMNCFYSSFYEYSFAPDLIEIAKKFDEEYRPLNIFIQVERKEEDYNEKARFHDFGQAQFIDIRMLQFLIDVYGKDDIYVFPRNSATIEKFVREKIING